MIYSRLIEACLTGMRHNPLKTLQRPADLQSAATRRRRRRRRWPRRLAIALLAAAAFAGLALLAHACAPAPALAPAHAPAHARTRPPARPPARARARAPTPPRARARETARAVHESRPLSHWSREKTAAVAPGTGEPGR